MFRHHALIEHLSVNLHDFIYQISHNLSRPNKKFLRDGLIGLIRAGNASRRGYAKFRPCGLLILVAKTGVLLKGRPTRAKRGRFRRKTVDFHVRREAKAS